MAHILLNFMPLSRPTFKGEKLPKQDMSDVFMEFYRLELVMNNEKEEHHTKHAIIRLVTIIEQFFRSVVKSQLEDKPNHLPKEIVLNTLVVDDIISTISNKARSVTKELIISLSYSFQNTGVINNAMCKCGVGEIFPNNSNPDDLSKDKYDELFKLRHEFVHTVNPPSRPRLEINEYHKLTEELMRHVLDKIRQERLIFNVLKGEAIHELGDTVRAAECFDRAIALKPDINFIYAGKGFIAHDLGEFDKSVECFDRAITLTPDDAVAHAGKGISLHKLGEFSRAVECFDKAIALTPNNFFSYSGKGVTLHELGEFSRSVECFDRAIALVPDNANTYSSKGFSLYVLEEFSGAVECFDRAIALDPRSINAYFGKGFALHELGKFNRAVECFDKAIALDLDTDAAHYGKGAALRELGEFGKAEECFDKAREVHDRLYEVLFGPFAP